MFAGAAPAAIATQVVSNCLDQGTGSLRDAVKNAASGELIDAHALSCSTITLTSGEIHINQNDLTINGPGKDKLTITGKYGSGSTAHTEPYRIFTHYGSGTLLLENLKATKGYLPHPNYNVKGGCVYSSGNVVLASVELSSCSTKTTSGSARGGAIYVHHDLTLIDSTVKYNTGNGGNVSSSGGGIFVAGNFTALNSSINGNTATGNSGATSFGGGLYARGASTYLSGTTIANNTAALSNGGASVHNLSGTLTIRNSTISGNKATAGTVGGLYSSVAKLYLYNSTIAFNSAGASAPGTAGAGVAIYGGGSSPIAVLSSSLLSNNSYGMAPTSKDLTSFGVTITGSNDLVRVPDGAVPANTLVGQCPLLSPLRNNGGTTGTHSLGSRSPAIDAGGNLLGLGFDQRGSPFARASGPPGSMNPRADIGAFEVNQADDIYNSSFEGC